MRGEGLYPPEQIYHHLLYHEHDKSDVAAVHVQTLGRPFVAVSCTLHACAHLYLLPFTMCVLVQGILQDNGNQHFELCISQLSMRTQVQGIQTEGLCQLLHAEYNYVASMTPNSCKGPKVGTDAKNGMNMLQQMWKTCVKYTYSYRR